MTYERHPLSAKYEDLSGTDWEDMVEGVREFGVIGRKITLHEGKVIDGWQLYRACLECGVKPDYDTLPKGMDPEEFVRLRNDVRRHEGLAQRTARRAERIERVAAARRNGHSYRAIAEDEGVGEATVRRDLENSTAPRGAVEPPNGRVTGKDGKSRPASQPNPPAPKPPAPPKILCKRCQRVGAVAGCTNCKMAREAARASANGDGKGDAHEGEPKEPKVALMDQLGNPVPKGLRDTFVGCRESLEGGVKLLQEVRRTVKGLSKWNAWMRPTDMETKLAELIEDLKNGLPYSVCQDCSGKGCKVCRQEGWLTKWRAEELAAK